MSLEHSSARDKSGQSHYQTNALNLLRHVHAKFCKEQRRGHVEPPNDRCPLRMREEAHRSETVAWGKMLHFDPIAPSNVMCEQKMKHQRSLALIVHEAAHLPSF